MEKYAIQANTKVYDDRVSEFLISEPPSDLPEELLVNLKSRKSSQSVLK